MCWKFRMYILLLCLHIFEDQEKQLAPSSSNLHLPWPPTETHDGDTNMEYTVPGFLAKTLGQLSFSIFRLEFVNWSLKSDTWKPEFRRTHHTFCRQNVKIVRHTGVERQRFLTAKCFHKVARRKMFPFVDQQALTRHCKRFSCRSLDKRCWPNLEGVKMFSGVLSTFHTANCIHSVLFFCTL